VLDLFHLRERAETPVRELSRGYQQRASLARAFLHDPHILLLDEPFTGLDAASTESLKDLMRGLPGEGKALVFSTHDFEQGAALAERLVILEAGRVSYDGPLATAPLASVRRSESKSQGPEDSRPKPDRRR
jgi:ABC-2 type transport system ATP-binding protein